MTALATEQPTAVGSIQLNRVSLAFGEGPNRVEALRNLNLNVSGGEFVSLLGPSGCGKSTLISAVAGLSPTTEGAVFVDGEFVEGPGPERGVVFQHHTLLPWKTVFENVEFGLKMRGLPRAERRAAVVDILVQVGLDAFAMHYPAQLSGGMQQRVNLARALVNRPRVLLMDEPFGALDAQTRLLMQELLLELWAEYRMTVVFVTHDIDEALFLADRCVVLSRRPAAVREEIRVEIARPRGAGVLTDSRFIGYKRHCLELLRAEAPRRSPADRLPRVLGSTEPQLASEFRASAKL
jgi:NitT/TauT family transport system ATP-binding protein